jgi:DNA replication protein DnaC
MESIKDTIEKIGQKHSMKSEQKYEVTCKMCKKEQEIDYPPKNWNPYIICDTCKPEYDRNQKEQEIKKREWEIKNRIEYMIPKKYREIETDKQDLLKTHNNKNLFITGNVGTGKTVFMASVAKHHIRQFINTAWLSYPEFIMKLQSSYRDTTGESPYEIAQKTATFEGILFIDDFGAEKLTDFVKQITYFILNEREQKMLRTVITSNFSLVQIDEQIDQRISSRICGMCEVLKFSGKDRRQEKPTGR